MDPLLRRLAFDKIRAYFQQKDRELYAAGQYPVRNTKQGIWGPSAMEYVFEAFEKIHLENHKQFIDLGSGDGRIVWIAALFTHAIGAESDPTFHRIATEANPPTRPPHPMEFKETDFEQMDLRGTDFIFANPDHTYPERFLHKITSECPGATILIYNSIYPIYGLQKEPTLWFGQIPILVYKAIPKKAHAQDLRAPTHS